jgi:hypothetical protein
MILFFQKMNSHHSFYSENCGQIFYFLTVARVPQDMDSFGNVEVDVDQN